MPARKSHYTFTTGRWCLNFAWRHLLWEFFCYCECEYFDWTLLTFFVYIFLYLSLNLMCYVTSVLRSARIYNINAGIVNYIFVTYIFLVIWLDCVRILAGVAEHLVRLSQRVFLRMNIC